MPRSLPRPIAVPSLLAADHAHLSAGLQQVLDTPARWVHLDIMDGHFVPNLSFGPGTVAALRKHTQALFFDVHLMLSNPDQHVDAFMDAGANNISVHVEPEYDLAATLHRVRQRIGHVSLAINPGTPAEAVLPWLEQIDMVLVMTVWPGFGGQSFIEDTVTKMRQLAQWRTEKQLSYRIEVDGGIDLATAPRCREAGVDTFVAGSAFFKAVDPVAFVQALEA